MTQPSHGRAQARVSGASRAFRTRIWLSQSLWVPVLVPNVVAVACGLLVPIIDHHEHLSIERSRVLKGDGVTHMHYRVKR